MDLPVDKTRILFIITQPSPWGGAQRYVHDVATQLNRRNWEVTVATGNNQPRTCRGRIYATTTAVGANGRSPLHARLHASSIKTVTLNHLIRSVRPIHNLFSIAEIYRLCRELNPDIVHLNSSMAGVLGATGARLAGVKKIVYTVHGLVTKEPLPFPLKLAYWSAEWIAGKFRDVTICVSENDRRAVIRQHIAPPERTVTIPIGIDPNIPFLSSEEARKALMTRLTHPVPMRRDTPPQEGTSIDSPLERGAERSEAGCVWIGTIAGLYKTKGLDTLIEATRALTRVGAENFQPLRFVIIGEGPERLRLETLIKKYGLESSVFLLGAIPDAAQYLRAFDCFVLPSVKEGMPYTILEALAADIPIIATNVGGIPEILKQDDFHRLVPPHDEQAIARAIETRTQQKERAQPLPLMTFPEIFTLPAMLEKTIAIYH